MLALSKGQSISGPPLPPRGLGVNRGWSRGSKETDAKGTAVSDRSSATRTKVIKQPPVLVLISGDVDEVCYSPTSP